MDVSLSHTSIIPMVEQIATSSTYKKSTDKFKRNNYQRRSIWIHAKRIFRKRLLSRIIKNNKACNMELALNVESTEDCQKINSDANKNSDATQRLLAPVLLQVFPYLDIYDRIRLRRVCRLTEEIFHQSMISLPPIKLQAVSLNNIEIWTDHSDLIIQLLVPEYNFATETIMDDIITIKDWQAELLVERIAKRVDYIEHLWLETPINGELCSALLKGLSRADSLENARWRQLKMDKMTIVGSDDDDCDVISKVVNHFSSSIRELCFRHICMDFGLYCDEFWNAIKQCQQLRQFQYQTCHLDSFSHMYLQQALSGKNLTTLELGGIEYLSSSILSKILANAPIRNLAIVCPYIKFRSYLQDGIDKTLKRLETLLIQCTTSFDLDNLTERECVIQVLQEMPYDGVLRIIHISENNVIQASRIMSYWLEIARETMSSIKLKLSGISQNRIDQAIGRLLRKCNNVFKVAFKGSSLMLTRGKGNVCILDKYMWFGEDDGDD
uniref:F-box domain-containing protein n=1 Tax=Onchocerca volvulus TaxID=6282 RepID=A0A2K6VK68_ONCVO